MSRILLVFSVYILIAVSNPLLDVANVDGEYIVTWDGSKAFLNGLNQVLKDFFYATTTVYEIPRHG